MAIAVNEDPTGEDVFEERNLVTVRRYRELPEAQMARGSLESSGIERFLTDDDMVRQDWFISNLLGGVKLLVSEKMLTQQQPFWMNPMPNSRLKGVGEYEQPRCPECQ